jgi:uncharacterized protein (TIGR02118 family)
MIKSIVLVKKRPDISTGDFYRYWKDVHGPLVAEHIPRMRKYVQNHFIKVPGYEYEGDGIIEVWYDDIESFRKSTAFNGTPEAGAASVKTGRR